ncbi:hypothetical protein JXQ31_17470 [candidate division KSB1 bacterium]|nr:hypothetical protein [candidate division KSB1 bacterium]
MNRAIRTFFLTLGILAGVMGIEHGIGEVLEGYRPTEGLLIRSWPDSPFFEIMAGEPAMTIIPYYLLSGLLSILFSCVFLVVLVKSNHDRKAIIFLLALLVAMLLTGAGFGPPVLGLIAVSIASKKNSSLGTWSRLPVRHHQVLSALWPWSLAICLIAWLMIFPGAPLVALYTGSDDPLLMIIPILVGFATIPTTLLFGFSRDITARASSLE